MPFYYPGSDPTFNRLTYYSSNRYARGRRLVSAMRAYSRMKGYRLTAGAMRAMGRGYIAYRRGMSGRL